MTPDPRDRRVRRPARAWSIAVGDGFLLYEDGVLRLLSGPAAIVWQHVDDVSPASAVAERVVRFATSGSPHVDAEQVRLDVLQFLDDLSRRGLVDVHTMPSEPGYARLQHVGYTYDHGTVLLVDLEDGRRRTLTATGPRIWELTCDLHYASMVVEQVLGEYPDAPASLAKDVMSLLEHLVTERFLHRWPPRVAVTVA